MCVLAIRQCCCGTAGQVQSKRNGKATDAPDADGTPAARADLSLSYTSASNGAPSPPLRLIGPQPANHKIELPLDLRVRAEPGRRVASLLARVWSNKEHTTRIAVIPCPGARSAIVRLQRRCVALDRLASTAAEHETTRPDRKTGEHPRWNLPSQTACPGSISGACKGRLSDIIRSRMAVWECEELFSSCDSLWIRLQLHKCCSLEQ